ncbi:MCE family protein, partial [Mycolicibacterium diernhoferi]
MLTRFIRTQLIVFTIVSIVGMSVMVFGYLQIPTLLGLGRYTVKLELTSSAGLYRFGNVTLRGVQIGKVTSVVPTEAGAQATLVLDTSPRIPADLQAHVRSVSAVGEQYVDLLPRTDTAPYLEDGSVISVRDTEIPQQVGPMLDQLSELVDSVPKERLSDLLAESYQGFEGAGDDFGSLFDSASTIGTDFARIGEQTRILLDDAVPLLDSQVQTVDSIRQWAHSLADVTGQLVANDTQIRTLVRQGPGAFDETSRLLSDVKPTLPVLLANLTSIGQIGVTYRPSVEQLLVLLPNYVGQLHT